MLRLLLALLAASLSVLAGGSLSSLSAKVSSHIIWDKLRKVRGTYVPPPLSFLVTPTSIAGGYQDIGDTLRRSFAFCSSDAHYTPTFLQVKSRAEAFPLPFHEVDCSPYNQPFTLVELFAALSRCSSTSAGPDDVHYDMLKHLPFACLSTLLVLYNAIWLGIVFLSSWRKAVVIPIPKPGKDH